ncbi:MAG: Rpn family recombination-promoting nuclease/putative transposase, partial [Prevotellaceae bacterium]|nr:Rpn family recombination-promoting nuclease/putative transposase [Prevotellaceae bacterium]
MKRTGAKQAAAKASPANKIEGTVYINPLTDFGFKKVFGDKELLIAFLNDIIMPEEKITDISYCPTEQLGDWESERKAVYDLLCTNDKGESFLVEMQRARQEFFMDRLLFYSSFLIRNQAPKGRWNFRLKAVYVVSLLNFVLYGAEADRHRIVSKVYLTEEATHAKFSEKLRFILIELPKFQKQQASDLQSNTDIWLFCLKNINRLQDVPAEVEGRIFRRLFEIAQIKKLTPKEMKAYHKSVLEYDDIVDALAFERKQSEERGEKRGIAIG